MSGTIPKRFLMIFTVFLLIFTSVQVAHGDTIDYKKSKKINTGITENFSDCIMIIFGKCNDVTGPLLWKFGLYCNFLKKDFTINAKNEEGDNINLMIRGGGSFKFLWGKEDINIQLKGATGILFWGGKSIIVESPLIIARCQVENAYLQY